MYIFLFASLVAIISFTFSISEFFSLLGLGSFDISDIIDSFDGSTFEEIVSTIGILLWGLFQLYGVPLIVFLVSFNGLAIRKAKVL